jgi:phosphatidylserine/phosphatidylglycerophosphate/cardiolipin synthase-like enzyme
MAGLDQPQLLQPGRTCWRVAPTPRAALLIDGAAYFAALADAMRRARHSIIILGWDIRSDIRLEDDGPPFRAFLEQLLRARRELRVRMLIWDWLLLYSLDRQPLPQWRFARWWSRRLRLHLDSRHPPTGCHHEKLVVIDGALAFVGGIDLTGRRRDTPDHPIDEPRRSAGERACPPFHDAMLMVGGEVAAAIDELARERWRQATGRKLPAPGPADPELWPAAVEPWFEDVPIGIARTRPAIGPEPAVREIEALYAALIEGAERHLYIENQYLTALPMAERIAARLAEPDGPEALFLVPDHPEGLLEAAVMDQGRERFIARLKRAGQPIAGRCSARSRKARAAPARRSTCTASSRSWTTAG